MLVQPVRVGETTTTTGTGTYTLAGAIDTGYATFLARLGAGTSRVHYACYSTAGYEVGIGEFNGSNQLSRSEIIYSSNSDNAVSWSAGTKTVIALWPGGSRGYHTISAGMTASQVLDHCGALVVFGSASSDATIALPAIANTPPGFSITFRNGDGTDLLTLDPDSSETIEGLASWVVYPGQTVTIVRSPATWLVLPSPRRSQVALAWVRFVAQVGPTITDSHRVGSVTRGGTGSYTINFSPALPDGNYAVVVTPRGSSGTGNNIGCVNATTSPSTTSVAIVLTQADGTTLIDPSIVSVIVFGAGA